MTTRRGFENVLKSFTKQSVSTKQSVRISSKKGDSEPFSATARCLQRACSEPRPPALFVRATIGTSYKGLEDLTKNVFFQVDTDLGDSELVTQASGFKPVRPRATLGLRVTVTVVPGASGSASRRLTAAAPLPTRLSLPVPRPVPRRPRRPAPCRALGLAALAGC